MRLAVPLALIALVATSLWYLTAPLRAARVAAVEDVAEWGPETVSLRAGARLVSLPEDAA